MKHFTSQFMQILHTHFSTKKCCKNASSKNLIILLKKIDYNFSTQK